MKKFGSHVQIIVSFDNRSEVYDFLQHFRDFLDQFVPIDNFDFQDIKLVYEGQKFDFWGDRK